MDGTTTIFATAHQPVLHNDTRYDGTWPFLGVCRLYGKAGDILRFELDAEEG